MKRRRGLTLIEIFAAVVLLAGTMSLAWQGIAAQTRQQRELERRAVAIELATGALEQLSARPYAEITADAAEQIGAHERSLATLPQGKVQFEIEPVTEPVPGKRITVHIAWASTAGANSVQLTTWVYAREENRP